MGDKGAEVVVVGSGATGGWVCKTLTEAGLSVILLEAGKPPTPAACPPHGWFEPEGRNESPARAGGRQYIQCLDPAFRESNRHLWVDDVDHPYVAPKDKPFIWLRTRAAGGRSNLWAGQSWRLTQSELEAPDRDGHGIAWPIRHDDLLDDYEAIERFQRLRGQRDGIHHVPDQIVDEGATLSEAESRLAAEVGRRWGCSAIATRTASHRRGGVPGEAAWSAASSLGSTLPAADATGRLSIIHNAAVARLHLARCGRKVSALDFVDTVNGRTERIEASAFVLCASTIESTRILLNSSSDGHPNGLGNSSGTLGCFLMDHNSVCAMGRVPDRDRSPGAIFHDGANGLFLPAFESAFGSADFRRGYSVWISLGKPAGGGVDALFLAVGEMLPYQHNRVTLDARRTDRWGLPAPRIECAFGENESRMQEHQKRALQALATAAGVELAAAPIEGVPGGMIHEVGTARMGLSPRTSFCNKFAQSWDVPNLFVPDGACWTTSGYHSPTLTMMAIARRCARFLARQRGNAAGARR